MPMRCGNMRGESRSTVSFTVSSMLQLAALSPMKRDCHADFITQQAQATAHRQQAPAVTKRSRGIKPQRM
ncbi:hypothetical protein [Hyphomicrobium sp. D-2]|uniref:hypothetical protein n=1 Tax=Hyphomicrobium sp. D-2 TaxID=3041621 RepID=UPI002456174C|nr:hypothetical protein [Hyphomicrobium sp. D-2]MDH4982613.1 hypothetical protein [Hyphomicrobium sp. D-2]